MCARHEKNLLARHIFRLQQIYAKLYFFLRAIGFMKVLLKTSGYNR